MPDERRDAVQRTRGGGEGLERRTELALPVHDVLAPQLVQQGVVLDRHRDALADVLAEPGIDRSGVAPAHHQVDAAVREVLEGGVVLGDLHRVVGGDQRGGRGQDQVLGARGDVAESGRRGGRDERRVVVLAGREDVQADLLDLLRDGQGRLDPLVLGGGPAGGRVGRDVPDGEDPELHGVRLPECRPEVRDSGGRKPRPIWLNVELHPTTGPPSRLFHVACSLRTPFRGVRVLKRWVADE